MLREREREETNKARRMDALPALTTPSLFVDVLIELNKEIIEKFLRHSRVKP